MKTLQIVGDSKYGGATYLILEWCKYLLFQGCSVDVLSTDEATIQELQKIPRLDLVKHIYIPREIVLFKDLKAFSELLVILRREQYDVVHTYTATPSFLGRMAARLAGVPVIVHHQAGWTVTEFSSLLERVLYTPLEYLATLASTKGICVSYAAAQLARQFHIAPQDKLVTICNGIEPEPFLAAAKNGAEEKLRQELNIPKNRLLIGNTGRLAPQKDNETLIRAMVSLKSLIPPLSFMLLLAGDGSDRSELEKLVQTLGLSDHIRFLGFRKDIPSFLAGLDIFAGPSLWEGLSISIMEAMAAAKPIVTTSILPNAELIEHEVTGLLVPPKSPEQVAEAIARFVREPEFAQLCAIRARQRVLEHYTIDRMFLETWNLYVDLLKRKQSIDFELRTTNG